jgi:hypothetical protein
MANNKEVVVKVGRPPIDKSYRLRVAELMAQGKSVEQITEDIAAEAKAQGKGDFPSFAWVKSYAAVVRRDAQQLRLNAPVHWPEDAREGLLPWEASAATLELLRLADSFEQRYGFTMPRPTVRRTLWFWRVVSACPRIDPDFAERIASAQAMVEWATVMQERGKGRLEQDGLTPAIEGALMYAPWRGPEAAQAYLAATQRERDPLPNPLALVALAATFPDMRGTLERWLGPEVAEEVMTHVIAESERLMAEVRADRDSEKEGEA